MNQEVGSIMGYLYKLILFKCMKKKYRRTLLSRLFIFRLLPQSMGRTQYLRFRKPMFKRETLSRERTESP